MNPAHIEVETALIDVRKAYRILHDYQRAAMDAAKYISTQLGFEYHGGYPLFSNCTPRSGRGELHNWAWDWLNMLYYDFHFARKIGVGESNLLIRLFSDTGYFDSQHLSVQKTDISTWAIPNESKTVVGFLFYKHWRDEFDAFRNSKDDIQEFLTTGDKLPANLTKGGVFGMCCPFSRISEQRSADVLVTRLIELAKSNGVQLERTVEKSSK